MAREKELFRENMDRLEKRFPDKEVLKYEDIANYLGRSKKFVSNHYKEYYNKKLAGISKTVVARILS